MCRHRRRSNTENSSSNKSFWTDLVLGACSVLGCADHQVNLAPLARLVRMFSDGEHRSRSSCSAFQPKRGEHPIHNLDVALQLHGSPKVSACCGLPTIAEKTELP